MQESSWPNLCCSNPSKCYYPLQGRIEETLPIQTFYDIVTNTSSVPVDLSEKMNVAMVEEAEFKIVPVQEELQFQGSYVKVCD